MIHQHECVRLPCKKNSLDTLDINKKLTLSYLGTRRLEKMHDEVQRSKKSIVKTP